MSVNEIIDDLLRIKGYYNDDNRNYLGFSKQDNDIIDAAIQYMLKYEQVEKSLQMTCIRVECNPEVIEKIKKALETTPINIRG